MVLAHHAVWGAYGFWLPNDPRGSWSKSVSSLPLRRFGEATTTSARHSVARIDHDHRFRLDAKSELKHSPVQLSGRQALAVAHGIGCASSESGYNIHACAIMPDHVHIIVGRVDREIGRVIGHLKTRARQAMIAEGVWPVQGSPVWAKQGWHVFLDSDEAVRRAIAYVEQNPIRVGLPRQRWSFVTPWTSSRGASSKLDG